MAGGARRERRPATAEEVEAAWHDTKLAQVLYHDWEAASYDDKWSISFDQRCIDYARDRFVAVAGEQGWPHGPALEIGAGTGFFALNLVQAGVLERVTVTDVSPAMIEAAQRNARGLGFEVVGEVADVESLPFPDESFGIVVGHAVLHHVPDVEQAFHEILRVLRPGGRFVVCGEPTRYGDLVARRLSRLTWQVATRITRLPPLRSRWARPRGQLEDSSRAAALETVVDLHTFDPGVLRRTALRAGGIDVQTVTEELTAAWFGWPVRTLEHALPSERLGRRWAQFAYRGWLGLSALDRRLAHVVPGELFYNVSITGTRPG